MICLSARAVGALAVSLALTLPTALGTAPTAAAVDLPPGGTFLDDDGSYQEPYVEALAAAGITSGCVPAPAARFCPASPVTRGQVAQFLAAGLSLAAGPDVFSDDEASPFEAAINAVAGLGAVSGCGPAAFCPNAAITRAEMATFVAGALGLGTSTANRFWDDDGTYAEGEIDALAVAGIVAGCRAGVYCGSEHLTRGDMAVILARALGLSPIPAPPRTSGTTYAMADGNPGSVPATALVPTDVVVQIIREAAVAHGIDPDGFVNLADCESDLNPAALGLGGRYGGLFQQGVAEWPARAEHFGFPGASIFDPTANSWVSAQMFALNGGADWPTCRYRM